MCVTFICCTSREYPGQSAEVAAVSPHLPAAKRLWQSMTKRRSSPVAKREPFENGQWKKVKQAEMNACGLFLYIFKIKWSLLMFSASSLFNGPDACRFDILEKTRNNIVDRSWQHIRWYMLHIISFRGLLADISGCFSIVALWGRCLRLVLWYPPGSNCVRLENILPARPSAENASTKHQGVLQMLLAWRKRLCWGLNAFECRVRQCCGWTSLREKAVSCKLCCFSMCSSKISRSVSFTSASEWYETVCVHFTRSPTRKNPGTTESVSKHHYIYPWRSKRGWSKAFWHLLVLFRVSVV